MYVYILCFVHLSVCLFQRYSFTSTLMNSLLSSYVLYTLAGLYDNRTFTDITVSYWAWPYPSLYAVSEKQWKFLRVT